VNFCRVKILDYAKDILNNFNIITEMQELSELNLDDQRFTRRMNRG